ncbi:MAG TPA: PepSY-associated TM helix domain-containing protein [Marinospirillum sp.]|uniref:PepSY-associated TM helix domain-containing protein n=1 Tax=Marinospirillum sp. TaxID=2183934 RepID=UPI002B4A9396|nr:PepSY-associated TM helix domain-containing protein [Marinospirillum sp.]HKM16463.1 PepSY-associated TM helix domain-containing protein [Marinospirillum sp.]
MKAFSLPKFKLSRSQRWVRPLHAYSSMLMLFILLFFTLTGLTLNNRQWLPTPSISNDVELPLAEAFSDVVFATDTAEQQGQAVWQWLKNEQGLSGGELSVQWSADESLLMLDIKRPGGYTLVEILPEEQTVWYENHSLGWMAIVNDLHMGRYSGKVWSWFIDLSAVVMLLFTLTGFWLVLFHPKRRSRTLLLSGFGTLLMVILYFWILL